MRVQLNDSCLMQEASQGECNYKYFYSSYGIEHIADDDYVPG